MLDEQTKICKENTILYELLIYSEWNQDPENFEKAKSECIDGKRGTFWGWLNSFTISSTVPAPIQKLVNLQMPWQFAVGRDGKVVAVLQEQCIEIRSSRDDYGTIIGRCTIPKDSCPQWRKILWSPDCSMLALALCNGVIHFFDLLGSQLFTLSTGKKDRKGHSHDISNAVVDMVFTDVRIKNTQWSSEFLVATYKGNLYSFLVSPTDGFQENHIFHFGKQYPRGITGVAYHPTHQILIVSGETQFSAPNETASKGFHYGITAWRFLSDCPHYQLITTLDDEINLGKFPFRNKFPAFPFYGAVNEDWVFRMSISPNGQLLAASHTSGILTLWQLPSLRLIRMWELESQPGYGSINPNSCDPGKRKYLPALMPDPIRDLVADINWWSDDAIILARYSGALTVSSVKTLKNQLGNSMEWFEPSPQISLTHNNAFLVLECDCSISTKNKLLSQSRNDESTDEIENESTFLKLIFRALSHALYFVTDIERFQPPKKKKKLLLKTFRMLCLKETTPEELFSRKLDNEEYGEALVVAKKYGLDCDLVYQRQWRKSSASVAAIQDYLSKIQKRPWVLHECLEKVPENIDAAKELILFGLKGTNIETLIAMGKGEDQRRFISCYQESVDPEDTIDDLLSHVDFASLTLEQKQLCQYRLKLFGYLDRLSTYEIILGGAHAAEEHYDHNFFKTFRSQSGFETAISFARNGNGKAVSSMLTYHGAQTLTHWLVILNNFPETTPPSEYRNVLPEAGYGTDEPDVYPWDEIPIRDKDWCEMNVEKICSQAGVDEFEQDFYEDAVELLKYRQTNLTSTLLSQWYSERAKEIVRLTGLVDNALELVKHGRERNIKGLETLHDELVTMETLVYDCQLEKHIMFDNLERMSDMEKIHLLMDGSIPAKYIKNVRQRLMPFLERVAKHKHGSKMRLLRTYLKDVAKMDFSKCKMFFEDSRPDQADPLIEDIKELLALALDCVYSCESKDDLSSCFAILECLPERSNPTNPAVDQLHDKIDQMEKHLSVAETLSQYGANTTPAFIRDCENSAEEVRKLLMKVTTSACNKTPALDESQWKELLKSMLDMQTKVFTCITVELCYEVISEALLNSSKKENIILSSHLMECGQKASPGRFFSSPLGITLYSRKLPFERSVSLILAAAQMYFNDAATLADSCILLARTCLNLVEESHPAIEEERDLISALSMLQEFSVNLIPLQVRLCSNRLELIEKALKSKAGGYKNCQKLLRLAMLLRLGGDRNGERDGQVLALVSKAAFEDKNYSFCYQTCQQLMEQQYQGGWPICQQLAQCSEFQDIQAKFELLNYALTFCTSDLLESLLVAKNSIELQDLQERLSSNFTTSGSAIQTEDEASKISKDTMHEVLYSATQTTKDAILTFGSKQFWKDAIKWVQPANSDAEYEDQLDSNKDLKLLGVPTFYSSLYNNCHLSKFDATYNKYVMPDVPKNVKIGQDLLRASLHESLQSSLTSTVLVDLAHSTVPEDFALSLAYLLALENASEANSFFEKLDNTEIGLELAVYYFALVAMGKENKISDTDNNFYGWDFCTLVNEVGKLAENEEMSHKLFHQYKRQLVAYTQAAVLHKLNMEIDIGRFSYDEWYKEEMILQLGMGTEEVFKVGKNLAKQYNLPLFNLYMVRLKQLLVVEKSIDLDDVKKEIDKHALLEVLTKSEQFVTQMYEEILPSVETTDRIKLCYEILEKHGDMPDKYGKKPGFHLKLMKKLNSLNIDINYAFLMSSEKSTSILRTHLTNENVNFFSKLSANIPCENGFHSSSSVASLWAEKLFIQGNSHEMRHPNSYSEWIQRFEMCEVLFQKMSAIGFLRFINAITFNTFAVHELSEASRKEITRRAVKYCKQKDSTAKGTKEKEGWKKAIQELQNNLEHLNKLEDSLVHTLRSMHNEYATKFDMTRSLPNEVEQLLLQAVMDAQPLATLQTLLALAPLEISMDTSEVFSKAISTVSEELRHPGQHPYLAGKDVVEVLESILIQIAEDGEILSEGTILEILRPLCCDNSIPSNTRINIIELLENTFTFCDEDVEFLLLSKTQALVSSAWPSVQVSKENIESTKSRTEFVEGLFASSETANQIKNLARLLLYWPTLPTSTSGDPTVNIWIRLLKLLISQGMQHDLDEVIRLLHRVAERIEFSEKCYWTLYHSITKKNSNLHSLKLAVLTRNKYIQKSALQDIANSKKFSESDYDTELLDWLLEENLLIETIQMPLYHILAEHVVSIGKETKVNEIAKELKSAGHVTEAEMLLALYKERCRPRPTGTIRSAISSLTRWLPGSDAS